MDLGASSTVPILTSHGDLHGDELAARADIGGARTVLGIRGRDEEKDCNGEEETPHDLNQSLGQY